MRNFQNEKQQSSGSRLGGYKIIMIALLVGLFGLLLGTLMHPAEAYQAYEIRISNLERRVDQFQFSLTTMDRRISQLETRAYTAPTTGTSQSTQSESNNLETQRLLSNRIDELQTQLENQQNMITELRKMIDEKEKPADEKKGTTKKPATPNPKP